MDLVIDLVVDLVVGEIVDRIAGGFAVRVVNLGKKMDLAKMLLERRCLRTAGGFWTVFLRAWLLCTNGSKIWFFSFWICELCSQHRIHGNTSHS